MKSERFTIHWSIGAILLAASGLKTYGLFAEKLTGLAAKLPYWINWSIILGEFCLGLWLISGRQRRAASIAVLVTFSGFASYSLFAALRGERSCGCFGQAIISPWIMFAIDMAVIAAILWWRSRAWQSDDEDEESTLATTSTVPRDSRRLKITWIIPLVALAVPLGWHASRGMKAVSLNSQDELFVFDPQEWLGKRIPFLDHVDIGEELSQGDWIVLLYHHDCPKCLEAVEYYDRSASLKAPESPRVAFVEVPPWSLETPPLNTVCLRGRLDNSREWFMQTPVHLVVSSGQIRQVSNEALDPIAMP